MPEAAREDGRRAFLGGAGWNGAQVAPLAGDASHRRYFRARLGGRSAILMDAPPETNADTPAFLSIAQYLSGQDLSAPRIIADDPLAGFVLLEDLGDDLFSAVLSRSPEAEAELYARATDVLIALARAEPPEGVPTYDVDLMPELATLPCTWYAPCQPEPLQTAMAEALTPLFSGRLSVALRDFHVDNLIWLPDRGGLRAVGLLDFQDAALCHPAYDLVSLLRDVRRDVPISIQAREMGRFASALELEPEGFALAAATLSAQRNLRILGVFARLSKRDGKTRYLDFLPRVWRLLIDDLDHPHLAALRAVVLDSFTAPDPAKLEALR